MKRDGLNHSDSPSSSLDAIAALFLFLVKNAIVSEHQVSKEFSRLQNILPNLVLDVPTAPAMLDEFENMVIKGECMAPST